MKARLTNAVESKLTNPASLKPKAKTKQQGSPQGGLPSDDVTIGVTPAKVESTDAVRPSKQKAATTRESASPLQAAPREKSESAAPASIAQLEGPPESAPEKVRTFGEIAQGAARGIGRGLSHLFFGNPLKPLRKEAGLIESLEKKAQELKTPRDFASKTAEFKKRLEQGESLEKMRPEVYSVAREAARQVTGMRAYNCQLLGALAMDDGRIAEMRTGEGKTLTAVLPLYLNALAGKGAHLVTVNETLAKRDADWMGPIFEQLGMSVGCVTEDLSPEEKRKNYNCDVTYVSDRALGFDFLRDRGVLDPKDRVQRGHFFALIDEVDEVLIDEATTPMIRSTQAGEASPDYQIFNDIVKDLVPGDDYKMKEEKRTVWLTEGGLRFVEAELFAQEKKAARALVTAGSLEAKALDQEIRDAEFLKAAIRRENAAKKEFDDLDYHRPNPIADALGFDGEYDEKATKAAKTKLDVASSFREQAATKVPTTDLYQVENNHRLHYLTASLKAHTLFRRGKDYSVENGEVKILDQNKGRVSNGKRYSKGLHQALEAKEGIKPGAESITISRVTMPELVGLYERKAGMTGTAQTSAEEFGKFYGLSVVEIPTNKPVIRNDAEPVVFSTRAAKNEKIASVAIEEAQRGRPVLVGTTSVNSNKQLAALFLEKGWPMDRLQILNAERVKGGVDYADANAGRSGTVTLTTEGREAKSDTLNYKKMAFEARSAVELGKPVLLELENPKDAEQMSAWLADLGVKQTDSPDPKLSGVQIRMSKPEKNSRPSEGFAVFSGEQFQVSPLKLEFTPEREDEIVAQAYEAFKEGIPVFVNSKTSKDLALLTENFMDRGLGLDSLPMVCDGKEKENVMIGVGGRSGMITVATNMAGRGANFKPDMVAIEHLANDAFVQASEGQAVTVDLDKEGQAVKLFRLMHEHIPVKIATNPQQKAQPGQILLRHGDDLETVDGAHLKGEDYATNGLLAVLSELAASPRVDNQFKGRSGRQGAEGDSLSFFSLEDEVPRVFGGERFEPLLELFGSGDQGVSSSIVNKAMLEAQTRIENVHLDQRDNSSKYDQVHREQRDHFYGLREDVLQGDIDSRDLVVEYGTDALVSSLEKSLSSKRKHEPEQVREAFKDLKEEYGLPFALDFADKKKYRKEDLQEALLPHMEKLFHHPNLDPKALKAHVLRILDRGWYEHLEAMDHLQEGIHLQVVDNRKPEDLFIERGFEVFGETIGFMKDELAKKLIPAAERVQQR